MKVSRIILCGAVTLLCGLAHGQETAPQSFKLGEELTLKGQKFYVEKIDGGRMILTAPQPPTQSIGAFITPIDASASASQDGAGRTARKLIDGSGWGETFPGSGVYIHSPNAGEAGGAMWNGMQANGFPWLQFDLGKEYNVSGFYVWNYNEPQGWNSRSVKDVDVQASSDGQTFAPVGTFTLEQAPGADDYKGQAVGFKAPVRARYFKWQIKSNYRGGEMAGLSEVRFANADEKYIPVARTPWQPKYPRPQHPKLAPGLIFPADAIVDVTKAPYNAKGDGVTDDTAAIQKALDDHPAANATIYLPNGIYLISDTLRWGGKPNEQKNTVLWGQSREGTIIKLRDDCPGFENPRKAKSPINTGYAPAQRFSNEIHNLTVDTGSGNPGACGVQFIANNQGGIYDVTIISGDGQGVVGLDLGYTNEQGPCLIKNVKVVGFDIGVRAAMSVDSVTLEHITVQHQNKFGVRNDGQPFTIRNLKSLNAVPAFYANGGLATVLDSELTGTGAAANLPAMIYAGGALMARNIKTTGYKNALESQTGEKQSVAGPNIEQYLSKPAAALFGAPGQGLRLAALEPPSVPWDDINTWASPQKFGAVVSDRTDDHAAIQQAIDSGATTVYLPRGTYQIGDTIIIRGNVRRIIGTRAYLNTTDALRKAARPVFRFADGAAPAVIVEGISTDFSSGPHFFLENNANRTLILSRMAINFQGADAYRGDSKSTVFIEDVVGRYFKFKNQTVWARQFNPEGNGTHVSNDGGQLWILGLKTEGGGTLVETKNGGKSEVLGGFSYTTDAGKLAPMFVVENAQASFTFSEVNFNNDPFAVVVRETRNGETKELKMDDPRWNRHFTLFTAGQ